VQRKYILKKALQIYLRKLQEDQLKNGEDSEADNQDYEQDNAEIDAHVTVLPDKVSKT
jgi:hypothetical protein